MVNIFLAGPANIEISMLERHSLLRAYDFFCKDTIRFVAEVQKEYSLIILLGKTIYEPQIYWKL